MMLARTIKRAMALTKASEINVFFDVGLAV
jgi:hypothetical protein